MGPIKFRSNTASIVIEDNLRASFVDDHTLSNELAVIFVEVNVNDMRNRPAVCGRQVPIES